MHLTIIEPNYNSILAVQHMINQYEDVAHRISFEHKNAEAFVNRPTFKSGYLLVCQSIPCFKRQQFDLIFDDAIADQNRPLYSPFIVV